jgi:hypothetical protein
MEPTGLPATVRGLTHPTLEFSMANIIVVSTPYLSAVAVLYYLFLQGLR